MTHNKPGYFAVDLENDTTGLSVTIRPIAAESAKKAVAVALAWVVNPGQWRCTGTDRCDAPDH